MTALHRYVAKAIDLAGETLMGRYAPLTGAAAQTATASSLAFGGNSEQRYAQWWLWRPGASATADHDKLIDSWAPGTGVFTHSGSAYSDTTATGETLYLLPPDLDPYKVRRACDTAIQQVREWDETIVPVVANVDTHWLADLDWIKDAASIRDVKWNQSPVITRNRYLQKRHTINTSGGFEPDYWTVSNNAAATPFTATTYRGQKTYYNLERSGGTNATLVQTVNALFGGVAGDPPSGETVTAVLVCTPANSSDLNIAVDDVDGAGDSTSTLATTPYQEVTTGISMASTTRALQFTVTAQINNASQQIYEAYACIGAVTDDVRRDTFRSYPVPSNMYHFEQGGPLRIHHPPGMGTPGQFIICSERPYPGFDATRLASGAADTDESDAPLVPVATGILAILMEQRLGVTHPDAMRWRRKFDGLCRAHLAYPSDGGVGKNILYPPFAAPPRRVR